MPRSHLSPNKLRLALILLALFGPLFFMGGQQAGAQAKKKRKAAPPAAAAPAPTPSQAGATQTAPKSQKANLVRMRSSDTSDGSNVTLESDGVLNKYSAYRSGDKFYVVVPDLDAQRAQGSFRGRGFDNVQVQKSGNDTVLVFRMQPGAKASVRQRFNRLDVVFNTPGGATDASQNSGQTQSTSNSNGNQSSTRTPPAQTQGGTTTTTPNSSGTNSITPTQPNYVTGGQTPGSNPYVPSTAPNITTAPTPSSVGPTPGETPAASPEATAPSDQIAQAQNSPAQLPASTSERQTSTSTTFATTLARNWGLALIIGLVLISLGLVVAARAKSRRDATDDKVKAKEEEALDAKPAKLAETPKLKAVPVVTTAAVAAAAKKADKEKASTTEKPVARESVVKETPVREVVAAEKDTAKEAVPVTTADIESASAEVRKLLAGESYDEAVIATFDSGTRQAVAAELLAALGSRNVERRERAREAFVKHNYLDEATYDLRTAVAPGERASAARALGLSQDKTATPHLIAALEDHAPEVRRASIEALAELRDSSALAPLEALLKREQDRKVPHGLIRRAIEASTTAAVVEEQPETPTLEAAAPVVEDAPQAVPSAQEEPQAVEPTPAVTAADEAVALAPEDKEPAIAETAVVASEAAALSLAETPTIETPAEVSAPLNVEIVTPPQRAESRKLRKKQARQKRAGEQSRKIAETEAARQKEQESAAQAAAAAEAARLLAEEQQRQRAQEQEAEARRQAEEEARAEEERQRLEAEARRVAEETAAREQAEAEARHKAEEEARRQAEAEAARRKAEEEAARLRAEEESRARAEEESRLRAEDEARQRAEAEARRKAEEEEAARLQAEAERRQAEEARQRAEAEAVRLQAEAEATRLRAEAEARRQAEEEARARAEEEQQRLEVEAAQRRAEEERQRAEAEEARARAEEERQRAEEEARQQAAAEAQRKAEEEAAAQAAAEAEAARQQAADEARRQAEEEAARLRAEEEEAARQRAEEEARRAAEEAETIHVTEADVITETARPVASSDLLIERNDGTAAEWFNIELGHADAPPVSPAASELSAVAPDELTPTEAAHETAITEWQLTEAQSAAQEDATSAVELVKESPAEAPKEIDLAVAEKGIAHAEDEFSTVPHSILRHLGSEDSGERVEAVTYLGRLGGEDAFRQISSAFDDPVQDVRNAAARALFELNTDRAASFTRALRESPMERRRNIGAALASSGLAGEAIGHLTGESREKTYDAFSLLFLMSKAGEVQPLMRAIEEHPNNEVRLAVVKLLALSGQQEILPAFRRLAVRGSLPTEVRSAVMEAIYQISSQSPSDASSRV